MSSRDCPGLVLQRLAGAILLALASLPSPAAQLLIAITGDRLDYTTAVAVGAAQSTAAWSNIDVFPVYAWQPGQLTNGLGSQSVTLTGNITGESVNLTLNVLGLAYGGIPAGFNLASAPAGLDHNTVVGKHDANTMVIDSGAASTFTSKIFQSRTADSHTPFTLVRPIFSFTTSGLIAALARLGSTSFQGTLSLPFKYRAQYVIDGVWSYEVRPLMLQVAVQYLPSRLENILVSGSGQLTTTYTPGTTEVRGEGSYTVQAKGVMPNGIRMRFLQPTRQFALQPTPTTRQPDRQGTAGKPIPYNLKCTSASATCQLSKQRTVVDLVTNGHFMGDSTGVVLITPTSTVGRDFQFNLDVNFTSGYVPTGRYQDNFVVMFDVVLD